MEVALGVSDQAVFLKISDDGAGFDLTVEQSEAHRGLRNMEARAHSVGGVLRLSSAPGRGTSILVEVPAAAGEAATAAAG